MTPRQLDELRSIPMGIMVDITRSLQRAGPQRTEELLALYEERIAIAAEGREPTGADIITAWEGALRVKFEKKEAQEKRECKRC